MPQTHPAYYGYPQNATADNGNCLHGGFLPENATLLIMGTCPPDDMMDKYNYGCPYFPYDSPMNHFWNRIENLIPSNIRWKRVKGTRENEGQNVSRKVALAIEKGWAFMDFFVKFTRKKRGSSDKDIVGTENVVGNGMLFEALRTIPSICQILCTYTTALDSLLSALPSAGQRYTIQIDGWAADRSRYIWQFEGRNIEIVLLYPASRSGNPGDSKDAQYGHFLM